MKPNTNVNGAWGSIQIAGEIWRHRNKYIFKEGVIDHIEIFFFVQLKVWSWLTFKCDYTCFSYFDWCLENLPVFYYEQLLA